MKKNDNPQPVLQQARNASMQVFKRANRLKHASNLLTTYFNKSRIQHCNEVLAYRKRTVLNKQATKTKVKAWKPAPK